VPLRRKRESLQKGNAFIVVQRSIKKGKNLGGRETHFTRGDDIAKTDRPLLGKRVSAREKSLHCLFAKDVLSSWKGKSYQSFRESRGAEFILQGKEKALSCSTRKECLISLRDRNERGEYERKGGSRKKVHVLYKKEKESPALFPRRGKENFLL